MVSSRHKRYVESVDGWKHKQLTMRFREAAARLDSRPPAPIHFSRWEANLVVWRSWPQFGQGKAGAVFFFGWRINM